MITKLSFIALILLISALCNESTKTAQRIFYISITFRSKCERYPQRSKTSKATHRKALHCD